MLHIPNGGLLEDAKDFVVEKKIKIHSTTVRGKNHFHVYFVYVIIMCLILQVKLDSSKVVKILKSSKIFLKITTIF